MNLFISFLCTLGIPIGIIRFVSKWESEGNWDSIYSVLKRTFYLFLIVSSVLFLFVFIFADTVSILLYGTNEYSYYITLFSLSIPLTVFYALFDAFIRGLKRFNIYVIVTIISSVLATSASILLVYFFGISGVALSFLTIAIIPIFLYLIFFLKNKIINFKKLFSVHSKVNNVYGNIIKLGIASLIIGLADYGTMIFLRSEIIKDLGISANGIYQVVFNISSNYLGLFFMAASVYTIPVLSEYKDNNLINSEINSFLRIAIIFATPLITLFFVFREEIVLLLYSIEFLESTKLFLYNFIGDYAKLIGTVLGLWLVPRQKVTALIGINFIYNISYIIAFLIIIKLSGSLSSIVQAYMIASILFLIANYSYFRFKNNFDFSRINKKSLIISVITLSFIITISNFNKEIAYYAVAVVIVLQFILIIQKEEYFKIKEYVLSKLKRKSAG